jgi:hypothetical protein
MVLATGIIKLINKPLIHLSLEKVAAYADHEVIVEVDDNIVLIVGNPQGILGQQLRPCQIHSLN